MWKFKKLTYGLAICLFVVLTPIYTYADVQPFYNFSVSVETDSDDLLNEKIEIYVEKDGKYYSDYNLSQVNNYSYQTDLQAGTYCILARVRYDKQGFYQIIPNKQNLTITDHDYQELHNVVFKISGINGEENEEEDTHEFSEYVPDTDSQIYTIEQIRELQNIQEQSRQKGEDALQELDEWEQKNNFLAQNNVLDPKIPAEDGNELHMHSYPSDEEYVEEQEDTIEQKKQEDEISEVMPIIVEKEIEENNMVSTFCMVGIVVFFSVVLMIIRKRGR